MIYRQLLLLPPYQRANERFGIGIEWQDRPRLSAQLLRCCQQLYNECEDILYGENVVRVVCCEGEIQIADAYVIVGNIHYYDSIRAIYPFWTRRPDLDIPQLGDAIVTRNPQSSLQPIQRSDFNSYLSPFLKGMLRLRRVEVCIATSSRGHVWDYVRLLRNLVANKRVSVFWENDCIAEGTTVDLLRSFYLWRCRSLTFDKLPSSLLIDTNTRAIVDLVTSQTPVTDLWSEIHYLRNSVTDEPALKECQDYLDDQDFYSSNGENYYKSDEERFQTRRRKRHSDHDLSDKWDKYDLWRIIRRGDTKKFRLWKKRFMLDVAQGDTSAESS